jgi:hypothetical protein
MNEISTEWDDKPCDIAGTLRALADKWGEIEEPKEVQAFAISQIAKKPLPTTRPKGESRMKRDTTY